MPPRPPVRIAVAWMSGTGSEFCPERVGRGLPGRIELGEIVIVLQRPWVVGLARPNIADDVGGLDGIVLGKLAFVQGTRDLDEAGGLVGDHDHGLELLQRNEEIAIRHLIYRNTPAFSVLQYLNSVMATLAFHPSVGLI